MSLHIDSLPDDCLLPIFDRVPLSDLLQLDRVCSRWASLLPSACARRHSLVLILGGSRLDEKHFDIPLNDTFEVSFDGRNPYYDLPATERDASLTLPNYRNKSLDEFFDHDDDSKGFFDILYCSSMYDPAEMDFTELARCHYAHFSDHLAIYLANLFPNVDKLVVIHTKCSEKDLHSLIDLVKCWSLKILKLWIDPWDFDKRYEDHPDQNPIRSLLHSINQQSSLRQLTLDIDYHRYIDPEVAIPTESFSFIAQLKVVKLLFGCYHHDNATWDMVNRLDSTELVNVGLGNCYNPPIESVLNPKYEFITTKVLQLYSNWCFESAEQLSEFCWQFSSLTMLRMDWSPHITFTKLVTNLAVLTQLTRLNLANIRFQEHPEHAFALVDQNEDDEPRPISLPQVKILEFAILNDRSHFVFESLSQQAFPSVEVIIVEDSIWKKCAICPAPITNRNTDPWVIHEQEIKSIEIKCHRQLIFSLKHKFSNPQVRLYSDSGHVKSYVDWSNTELEEEKSIESSTQVESRTKTIVILVTLLLCCLFIAVCLFHY